MLENLFENFEKEYHIKGMSGNFLHVEADCPKERLEELREMDKKYLQEFGRHQFDIFAKEATDGTD